MQKQQHNRTRGHSEVFVLSEPYKILTGRGTYIATNLQKNKKNSSRGFYKQKNLESNLKCFTQ
jgi:predicted RNA-binding protein YlxR (DUF448 family)